mmetsp:Transcript_36369/g.86346  ORF Transcript_36369/g.86346 Transcript_36369/m.86346 type:complete len:279 (+) Transcript_36369:2206-3042(+)
MQACRAGQGAARDRAQKRQRQSRGADSAQPACSLSGHLGLEGMSRACVRARPIAGRIAGREAACRILLSLLWIFAKASTVRLIALLEFSASTILHRIPGTLLRHFHSVGPSRPGSSLDTSPELVDEGYGYMGFLGGHWMAQVETACAPTWRWRGWLPLDHGKTAPPNTFAPSPGELAGRSLCAREGSSSSGPGDCGARAGARFGMTLSEPERNGEGHPRRAHAGQGFPTSAKRGHLGASYTIARCRGCARNETGRSGMPPPARVLETLGHVPAMDLLL